MSWDSPGREQHEMETADARVTGAELCEEIGHDWHDGGGGIEICGECESEREAEDA